MRRQRPTSWPYWIPTTSTRRTGCSACSPGALHGGPYFAFSGVTFLKEPDDDSLDGLEDSYNLRLGQGMFLPTAGFAFLRSNFAITASNFVISRGLFDAVGGFDPRIKVCQDWDFAIGALRFVEPTFVPEPLVTYRIHSRNTSRNAHEFAAWERDLVVEKLCEWIAQATPNSRAPTPRNWPRYFRVFAHLSTFSTGRPFATQLRPALLAPPAEAAATPRDQGDSRRPSRRVCRSRSRNFAGMN